MLEFDERASRRVEATYLTRDVVAQRQGTRRILAAAAGERVLDIGSGPGLLAAELAVDVGPEGAVDGVDPSPDMLAIAERRERPAGSGSLAFARGDAGALPYADATFDAAVATQVYEYVPDMPAALAEARRVLRPGGRLLVLDTDWDSIVWHSRDPARMRRVLTAWDEHLADPHLPRRLPGLLREAGFSAVEASVLPVLNSGFDPDTFSAGLIGFVSAFVPGRQGLTAADVTAWAEDLRTLGPDYFFCFNRFLFLATN